MKSGARIRTTYPVRYGKGFIPPSTEGEILRAIGSNAYHCEFTGIEIETGTGTSEKVTITTTVLVGYFYEIPAPAK